jgi:LPS sulfotransferase NodH
VARNPETGNFPLDRSKAPVFVLGSPRSGTTYLYNAILSSGNFATYFAESDVFDQIAPGFGDLRSEANRKQLLSYWLRSDYFKRTGLTADEVQAEVLSECRNFGDFLRIFMERIAKKQGAARWAENTPNHLLQIPQIKSTIPNALIIHIIRDGRDVAMSLSRLRPWGPGRSFPWDRKHGLVLSGLYWNWIVRKGRKYGRRLGPDYIEVRYEELVQNPRQVLKVLGDFIQHDLNYECIQQNAIGPVKSPNSSFKDSSSEGKFNPVQRWKSLMGKEAERLQALLRPLLRELGYEIDPSARMDLTVWRLRMFYLLFHELKEAVKKTPLSPYFVSKEFLQPGYLDRLSYWKGAAY